MTPSVPSEPSSSRSGLGPAPEPGSRRDSHAPTGVTARTDSTSSSMCVSPVAKWPPARVAIQPPERRELERLREVAQRQPVRRELLLQRRTERTGLDARGAGDGVDLQHAVERRERQRDGARVADRPRAPRRRRRRSCRRRTGSPPRSRRPPTPARARPRPRRAGARRRPARGRSARGSRARRRDTRGRRRGARARRGRSCRSRPRRAAAARAAARRARSPPAPPPARDRPSRSRGAARARRPPRAPARARAPRPAQPQPQWLRTRAVMRAHATARCRPRARRLVAFCSMSPRTASCSPAARGRPSR